MDGLYIYARIVSRNFESKTYGISSNLSIGGMLGISYGRRK